MSGRPRRLRTPDRRHLTIFGAVVALSLVGARPAAAIDPPEVGPPHPVSSPVYQTPPNGRDASDVVAGGAAYLAVWEDSRTFDSGNQSEIYAARIAPDGTILDPGGIRVTSAPGQQGAPRVAWSGSEYLVVWTDHGTSSRSSGVDVYGARISAEGAVLDPVGVPIADGPLMEWQPDVTWNGSAFVVAWTTEVANGSDIRVERLTPGLQTIGPDDLNFAASSFRQSNVSLAVDGTTTVAIYTDARDEDTGDGTNVYMNRLTASGEMLDDGFPIATGAVNQIAGGVAGSPTGVLATWTSFEGGASGVEPAVHARRFIGEVGTGPVLDVAETGEMPRVSWGPDGYLVAWKVVDAETDADVIGRYVSGQSVLGNTFAITTGADSEDIAAVAADGSAYLVAATGKDFTGGAGLDILAVRVDGQSVVDDPPLHPAKAARVQDPPAVVDTGSALVAVWAEQDATTGWDIRMGRIGPDGQLLDGVGSAVAATAARERFPSVGWNGSQLLVTWSEDGDPVGRMIARPMHLDGTPAGPLTVLGTGVVEHRAAVASNGTGFAVGWGRLIVGEWHEIRLQMFDGEGIGSGGSTILVTSAYGSTPAIAPLGAGYVAAWSTTKIEAKRLTADGTPIDATPLLLSSSDTALYEDSPAIASSGNQVLVTWIRHDIDLVQAVRIDASGGVLDSTPMDLSEDAVLLQGAPVGWNGLTYEVAWWGGNGLALTGAEVNQVGELIDRSTLASVPGRAAAGPPTVASGTLGRVTVGYGVRDLGPVAGGTMRAALRFVDLERPPVNGETASIDGAADTTNVRDTIVSVSATHAALVALSNDGGDWTTRAYAPSQPWSLPAGDGLKTVWVKWRDAIGNWSGSKSDTIVLDTVAPSGSVSIAGGSASTSTPAVTVSTPATDATSGVASIALSNDGATWTTRPYAASQAWTLVPGDGPRTVSVKWADGAGNWSSVVSDTITVAPDPAIDRVAPTATAPTRALVAGTSVSGGRLPVRLRWSGADVGSGIDHYEIAKQTDRGSWSNPSIAPTAAATPTVLSGHTYRFRVRAIDEAGNVGAWAYGSAFKLTAVQQSSGFVRYRGTWSTATSSTTWWGGSAKRSSSKGSTAALTFTGRSIAWVGLQGADRGKANVYVNGVLKGTVDLYAPTTQKQRLIWSANYSTSATRTVTIKVLGTSNRPRLDLDGFIIGH